MEDGRSVGFERFVGVEQDGCIVLSMPTCMLVLSDLHGGYCRAEAVKSGGGEGQSLVFLNNHHCILCLYRRCCPATRPNKQRGEMTSYFCMFAAEELNPRHSIITNADKNTRNKNRVLSTTCPIARSGGSLFRIVFAVIPVGIKVTILQVRLFKGTPNW